MARYYRIHPAGEALDTVLDPRRPDGWVASDEAYETQPIGVSACPSLADLASYARHYSLRPQPGDVVLALRGSLSPDRDRDARAVRVIADGYEVLGDARAMLAAAAVDLDDLRYDLDHAGDDAADYASADEVWEQYPSDVRPWLRARLAGEWR
jgi:hypothetical protein